MTTWVRTADADEAAFLALAASESVTAHDPSAAGDLLVRVAICDGQVAGFYGLIVDEPPRLAFLLVSESRRGAGIGRLLLHDCRRRATLLGCARVRITAHPSATAFFRRCGAVRTGTSPPNRDRTWSSPDYALPVVAALEPAR